MTWRRCLRIEGALIAVLMAVATLAVAQEEPQGFRQNGYFDCPYINFFDQDCPQHRPPQPSAPRPGSEEPAASGSPPAPPAEGEFLQPGAMMRRYLELQKSLGDRHRLFPKQSMAPDAPPLFQHLLIEPTLDTARLYVLWHAARAERLHQALGLIEAASAEHEAGGGSDGATRNRSLVGGPAGR